MIGKTYLDISHLIILNKKIISIAYCLLIQGTLSFKEIAMSEITCIHLKMWKEIRIAWKQHCINWHKLNVPVVMCSKSDLISLDCRIFIFCSLNWSNVTLICSCIIQHTGRSSPKCKVWRVSLFTLAYFKKALLVKAYWNFAKIFYEKNADICALSR